MLIFAAINMVVIRRIIGLKLNHHSIIYILKDNKGSIIRAPFISPMIFFYALGSAVSFVG